jgi:hypothetical protein
VTRAGLVLTVVLAPLALAAAEPAAPPTQPAMTPRPSETRRRDEGWSVRLSQWTVFDSNIDHEAVATRDLGMVLGAELGWKGGVRRSRIQLVYDLAGHRYRTTDEWDRMSHHALASFEPRVSRWLGLETIGDVSLNGTSEDRELGDQYQLVQRLEPRLARGTTIRLDGSLRLKRYEDDRQRNATNRYLEAELRQRLGGARLEMGSRFEINDAVGARNRYARWTHRASLRLPTGRRNELELAMKFRLQSYPHRLVEVGGEDVPRQDRRLIPSLTWAIGLWEALRLRLAYEFDQRTSNDPEKDFAAHRAGLELSVGW